MKDSNDAPWVVYILHCRDGTLYTGITTDIDRRLSEHNDPKPSSKAAKYTRARQPVRLVYTEHCGDRSIASKREHAIKTMSRAAKLRLLETTT